MYKEIHICSTVITQQHSWPQQMRVCLMRVMSALHPSYDFDRLTSVWHYELNGQNAVRWWFWWGFVTQIHVCSSNPIITHNDLWRSNLWRDWACESVDSSARKVEMQRVGKYRHGNQWDDLGMVYVCKWNRIDGTWNYHHMWSSSCDILWEGDSQQ